MDSTLLSKLKPIKILNSRDYRTKLTKKRANINRWNIFLQPDIALCVNTRYMQNTSECVKMCW